MKWSAVAGGQRPYMPPVSGEPSPGLAALLGAIPGVGAMYNGQFVKGMVHVVIFAVLVSVAHVYDVFGIFVAAWIFYQMFEAYHTAKARRDGDPLPDPLGLNELSNSILGGMRSPQGPPPGPPPSAGTSQGVSPGASQGSSQGASQGANSGAEQAANQPPYQAPYQAPYQTPYQSPYQGPGMPPIPPVPPVYWRRREPVGAVILIALGVLFLLGQFDWFSWNIFQYFWPLLLIGLGVWLIVRRLHDAQGGQK